MLKQCIIYICSLVILTGCNYEYNLPGLYVDYKFKVERIGEAPINTVKEYGYEFLGTDVRYSILDEEGKIVSQGTLWPQEVFSLKKSMRYFQVTVTCYGKPNVPGSNKLEVCTIYYKPLDMAEYRLFGDEQESIETIIFEDSDIDHIEYNPDVNRLYIFYIEMKGDPKYVTDYGYEFADAKRYYQFYDSDGNLVETKERSLGTNEVVTEYVYTGGYIEYYGFINHNLIKICTAYYKKESSKFLTDNSSKSSSYQLELERIEYEPDIK